MTTLTACLGSSSDGALVANYNFTTSPGATVTDEAPGADGSNDIAVNIASGSPSWLASEDGRTGVMRFTNNGSLILSPPALKPANGGAFTVALWAKANTGVTENLHPHLPRPTGAQGRRG